MLGKRRFDRHFVKICTLTPFFLTPFFDEPDLDWFNCPRSPSNPDPDGIDQPVLRSLGEGASPTWCPEEIPLDDGRILVLEYS